MLVAALHRLHGELPLTPEEFNRAISAPAEQVGVTVERGLATAIIAKVHEQPGALPMLQYALTELFERPVQIGHRKAVALLAYLATEGGRHSRPPALVINQSGSV